MNVTQSRKEIGNKWHSYFVRKKLLEQQKKEYYATNTLKINLR